MADPPPSAPFLNRQSYGTADRPTTLPTAPPQSELANGDAPPQYDEVLEQDPDARERASRYRTRQLMGSVAYAGKYSQVTHIWEI